MKKSEVISAAQAVADKKGRINVTRSDVSAHLGIKDGSWPDKIGISFEEVMRGVPRSSVSPEPTTRRRVNDRKLRREQILAVAVRLSETKPFDRVTRQEIADAAGVCGSLVTQIYTTMPKLRRDVIRTAIRTENVAVLARALASGDSHATKAPPNLKAKAVQYLAEL